MLVPDSWVQATLGAHTGEWKGTGGLLSTQPPKIWHHLQLNGWLVGIRIRPWKTAELSYSPLLVSHLIFYIRFDDELLSTNLSTEGERAPLGGLPLSNMLPLHIQHPLRSSKNGFKTRLDVKMEEVAQNWPCGCGWRQVMFGSRTLPKPYAHQIPRP